MLILLSCLSRCSFKPAVHGGDVGESGERPPERARSSSFQIQKHKNVSNNDFTWKSP